MTVYERIARLDGHTVSRAEILKLHSEVQNLPSGKVENKLKKLFSVIVNSSKGYNTIVVDFENPKFTNELLAMYESKPSLHGPEDLDGFEVYNESEALSLGIIDEKGLGAVNTDKLNFRTITNKIIAEIRKGNLVWRKPWNAGYVDQKNGVIYGPHNYQSKHIYRGMNAWWIALHNLSQGTRYTQFLTQKQIDKLGGKLEKGAKPISVHAFVKGIKEKVVDGKKVEEKYVGFVGYYVYPIEFVTGLREIKSKVKATNEPIADAESIIEFMPKKPEIRIQKGSDRAYYQPATDQVTMPHISQFKKAPEYYSTLFHELIHSTGHKKRLGREFGGRFGDAKYAYEELIAELGAAYLCGATGIEYYTMKNTAAYLKSWSSNLISHMQSNAQLFLRAVNAAEKAADYILDGIRKQLEKGKKPTPAPVDTPSKPKESKRNPGKKKSPQSARSKR